MPPPNTPNDGSDPASGSGSSSPNSTHHERRNSGQMNSPAQASATSDFLVRDLHTMLFAGPPTPTRPSSGSVTPAVATTPITALGANSNAQRAPNERTSSGGNMLAPTGPTVSTTPAMAVGTNYNRRGRAAMGGRRREPLRAIDAARFGYPAQVEYTHIDPPRASGPHTGEIRMSTGSPYRSSSPSPTRDTAHASNPQRYEPVIDWQCLQYVDQVDENLLCAICKAPFYKPMTTKACGHTFCEACIDQALEEARGRTYRVPCPLCRTDLGTGDNRASHRFVRVVEMSAQLDRLVVKCPNNAQVCKWKGQRSSLEDHVRNVCDYTLYPCPSSSCDKMIIRKSWADELPDGSPSCRHFTSACSLCNETIDMSTQVQHLLTSCREYLASCSHCGETVVREELTAHEDVCANEETPCGFAKMGCPFTNTRAEIKVHEKTCKLAPAMLVYKQLEQELKADLSKFKNDTVREMKTNIMQSMELQIQRERRRLDAKIEEVINELREERRKRQELALRLSKLSGPPRDIAPGPAGDDTAMAVDGPQDVALSRPSLPIPVSSDYEQAEYMFRMFDELDTRISDISKALIDQDARHSVMLLNELMPVKEQLVEARSQLGVMGMHVRWLMDIQRSRQRQIAEAVGSLTGGSESGSGSGSGAGSGPSGSTAAAATGSDTGSADSGAGRANPASDGAGGSGDNASAGSRRLNDRASPVRPSL
ncbi:hypothetical protein VPNG_09419 [Cytospora leucostoma]|uniref:RING-type domain-containing protein n=1 Tax=Cytospora leucostoma TaxID=1230097 RepID=A0A423VPT8_9PEZI|nr:hypothetical protein VPNG_09419 [Cytospora leucostoma]